MDISLFDELLERHLEGDLPPEEEARLMEAVADDRALADRFAERIIQDELLADVLESYAAKLSGTSVISGQTSLKRSRQPRRHIALPIFAAVAALAVAVFLAYRIRPKSDSSIEPTNHRVAEQVKKQKVLSSTPAVRHETMDRHTPVETDRVILFDQTAQTDGIAQESVDVTPHPEETIPAQQKEAIHNDAFAERTPESESPPSAADEPKTATGRTTRAILPVALSSESVGEIQAVNGVVQQKSGGGAKWFRVAAGARLQTGDTLRTNSGQCWIALDSGATVALNSNTIAVFNSETLNLKKGELGCDYSHGVDGPVVVTAHSTVKHLGTQFSVKTLAAMDRVIVAEGRVEVKNAQGSVDVPAGYQVKVPAGKTPGQPREVDADKFLSFLSIPLPSPAALFSDDLERHAIGASPYGWIIPDEVTRAHFVVVEDGEKGHSLACVGQQPDVSQHLLLPVVSWPDAFTVQFSIKLSGHSNNRAGVEIWRDKLPVSVEYDASSERLRVAYHIDGKWREEKSVAAKLTVKQWHSCEVRFTGESLKVRFGNAGMTLRIGEDNVRSVSLVSRGVDSAVFDDVVAKKK